MRMNRAFSRVTGASLIRGNRLRLLKDAGANYPEWIRAIESAEKCIHFESYIIHEDQTGCRFADLLSSKARQGVKVRLIYDWVGARGNSSRSFWRRMMQAGVEVRCFNPPQLDSPLGWLSRDHRKIISVDGRIAFISGLCVGQRWLGEPAKGLDAWRDTGLEIQGPALADIEAGFAETWRVVGEELPDDEIPRRRWIQPQGDVALRIVSTVPNEASIYRTDHLVAATARRYLWLADAYFLGTTSYVQALTAAARSGVDVRLLIPGASDIPVIRALSRAGLRPLLEAGVRVFEWNGSMMHAKTAVADGYWSRIGSTNLNLFSWVGNWELDAIVEDVEFAREMEDAYRDDLARSTEIVLDARRSHPAPAVRSAVRKKLRIRPGSGGQTAARIARLSHAVGAAITNRRELGPAEKVIMLWGAALLASVAAISAYWPKVLAFPLAFLCAWLALSLIVRVIRLGRRSPSTLHSKREIRTVGAVHNRPPSHHVQGRP